MEMVNKGKHPSLPKHHHNARAIFKLQPTQHPTHPQGDPAKRILSHSTPPSHQLPGPLTLMPGAPLHHPQENPRKRNTAPKTHLNAHSPHPLARLPHANRHIRQQWRMPHVARVRVPMDVGAPFMLGCVGVSSPDVAGLQLLELLLRAQFVGLCFTKVSIGWKKKRTKSEMRKGRGIPDHF